MNTIFLGFVFCFWHTYKTNSSGQDCGVSSASTLEIQQSCTKPSIQNNHSLFNRNGESFAADHLKNILSCITCFTGFEATIQNIRREVAALNSSCDVWTLHKGDPSIETRDVKVAYVPRDMTHLQAERNTIIAE